MKMSYGRKFWGCIIALTLIMIIFFFMLFIYPISLTPNVILFICISITTISFAYIGGNVWSKWAKSKYFNSELKEEEKEDGK